MILLEVFSTGHGKRNGGGTGGGGAGGGRIIRLRGEDGPERVANTRWYLSRLVQVIISF